MSDNKLNDEQKNLAKKISLAIDTVMKQEKITLSQLCEKAQVSQEHLENQAAGKYLMSVSKLDRIAEALDIDAFALYKGEVKKAIVSKSNCTITEVVPEKYHEDPNALWVLRDDDGFTIKRDGESISFNHAEAALLCEALFATRTR
jgi:transcriptional regulator with XRE-family HTH domain